MTTRRTIKVTGTVAEAARIQRQIESLSEGEVTVRRRQHLHEPLDLSDEPRVGQQPLVTLLIDFTLAIGASAAYDLLKIQVQKLGRGSHPKLEEQDGQEPEGPDNEPSGSDGE